MSTIDASKMDRYIDGKLVKEGMKDDKAQTWNLRWWDSKEHEIAKNIQQTINFISSHQGSRLEQLLVSTRLYGNTSSFSFIGAAFSRASSTSQSGVGSRIGFNLCSSVIDTLTAKIAKNKVVPVFITNGGDWKIQQRAQKLSKFTEGVFYETDAHEKLTIQFRDSGVWGDGILFFYKANKKIHVERAFPHEFFVDSVECLTRDPRQLHWVRLADRGQLLTLFKDGPGDSKETKEKNEMARKAIMEAHPASIQDIGGEGTVADLIVVTCSWHLPSDPDASEEETDGRYVVCVGEDAIINEPYTKDFYPFSFRKYNKRLLGFWGQGACERLQNLQAEINKLMILVQRSMWLGGSFKILVENGSKVVSQHLNNEVGAIIHYVGTPPQYITPPMIQQDIYPYIDSLIAKGYQQEGVSQLAASSMKPAGLDSGKAIRTYNDIEADRQLFTQQQQEEACLEYAFQAIELAKEIYEEEGKYKVMFPTTRFCETIDWKEVKLDEDQYVMKAFPMSSLASNLSGRLQEVKEMAQAGFISPRLARKLMRFPDIEMADNLATAPEDLLHQIYENMLEEDKDWKYQAPEPFYDLALAQELGLQYYNYAKFHNAPEELLNRVTRFIAQAKEMTMPPTPPPPMNGPGIGPGSATAPQAVPEAPPVSNLLPNLPGAA